MLQISDESRHFRLRKIKKVLKLVLVILQIYERIGKHRLGNRPIHNPV